MKLAIAVIQDEYITRVTKILRAEEIRITKLASTGGFLKDGSTTLLIGIEDDQVDYVIDLIKCHCKGDKINDGEKQITVCGANVFLLSIDKYVRI